MCELVQARFDELLHGRCLVDGALHHVVDGLDLDRGPALPHLFLRHESVCAKNRPSTLVTDTHKHSGSCDYEPVSIIYQPFVWFTSEHFAHLLQTEWAGTESRPLFGQSPSCCCTINVILYLDHEEASRLWPDRNGLARRQKRHLFGKILEHEPAKSCECR